jgi:HEAT repeat protein
LNYFMKVRPGVRMILFLTVVLSGLCAAAETKTESFQSPEARAVPGADLDTALNATADYRQGQSRESLAEVERLVRWATSHDSEPAGRALAGQLAEKMAKMLTRTATADCKEFLCRQLFIIGTQEQAPALASLLTNERLSFMARYALEGIGGPEADKALREALNKVSGQLKVGVIHSIGNRRDSQATGPLIPLLNDSDNEIVEAAAAALGKIGGNQAAEALEAALAKKTGPLRLKIADAYLMCADHFMAKGETASAMKIYEQMYQPTETQPIRMAALHGLVVADNRTGIELVVQAIAGDNLPMQRAAISLLPLLRQEGTTKALAEQLPRLSAPAQALLLGALADRGDKTAFSAVNEAVRSENEPVRVAALKALGKLGDASSVKLLSERMAGSEAERDAARQSLDILRGEKVNELIVEQLKDSTGEVKVELIRSLAERNAKVAVAALIKTAEDTNSPVRTESWKALRALGGEKELPDLIELLVRCDPDQRKEAEKTVAGISRGISSGNHRSELVLKKMNSATAVQDRCSLLRVLGNIGDDSALACVRQAVKDEKPEIRDTAIRVLCSWPTPRVIDDLLNLAGGEQEEVYHILALRGFVRLLATAQDRSTDEKVELLGKALKAASRIEEKKILIGELGHHPSLAAMQLAQSYLTDNGLVNEAAQSIVAIGEAIKESHKDPVREAMQMVIKRCEDARIVTQANALLLEVSKSVKAGGEPIQGPSASQGVSYRWRKSENSFALLNHDNVVWQFNFDRKYAKPYFYPVRLSDGTDLVELGPPDHPWHRALWFSWKMINGVNYWEEDVKTGLAEGRTEVLDIKIVEHEDFSARVEMTLGYHPPDKPTLLTEKRLMTLSAPDETGGYCIDWKSSFTAGSEDVLLKGGTAGGGYAGLSVRIAKTTSDWELIDSEGRKDVPNMSGGDTAKNTHGQKASWMDFTLFNPQTQKAAGIAIFDHPGNPRYPSQWHNVMEGNIPFGYFSPAMLWSEPYSMPAGANLMLRYRIVIHPGRTDRELVSSQWKQFSSTKD